MTRIEKFLIILVISVCVFPLAAKILSKFVAPERFLPQSLTNGLVGVTLLEVRPDLSLRGWFTREFQEQFSKWFNQSYAGRSFWVRMGNQLNYSLFDKSYMNKGHTIIGRQGQLFEDWYIDDYCNPRLITPLEVLDSRVKELAELQSLLAREGSNFLLLITPSKAAIYPTFIPNSLCQSGPLSRRNYNNFLPLLDKHHVRFVDGHSITQQAAQMEKVPLFCQGGVHWNYLGAYYTVKAVISQLHGLLRRNAGQLNLDSVEIDHIPTGSDKDLAELLNLFFPPFHYVVPHPVISKQGGTDNFGRALIIGNSFNWIPIDLYEKHKIFKEIEFLYYYKAMHIFPGQASMSLYERGRVDMDIAKIDWAKTITNSEVIILEVNEADVTPDYASAFISDALQYLRTASHQS